MNARRLFDLFASGGQTREMPARPRISSSSDPLGGTPTPAVEGAARPGVDAPGVPRSGARHLRDVPMVVLDALERIAAPGCPDDLACRMSSADPAEWCDTCIAQNALDALRGER